MPDTVHHRLFDRLAMLIPDLAPPASERTFYAPSRRAGDLAAYCTLSAGDPQACDVQIAHAAARGGHRIGAPALSFRVDLAARRAELTAVQDEWRYEVLYADDGEPNPRQAQMNEFALGCLSTLLDVGKVFRPTAAGATDTLAGECP